MIFAYKQKRDFDLIRILLSTLILLMGFSLTAYADEELDPVKSSTDGTYVDVTLQNVSKLYWALAILDIDNDHDIEQYLQFNECDLYSEYRLNDFEMAKLIEAARNSIKRNMSDFPKRFGITLAIELGTYDTETQTFEIVSDDNIHNVKRLEARTLKTVDSCLSKIRRYDLHYDGFVVNFLKQLDIKRIPVHPEIAADFIRQSNQTYEELADISLSLYKRKAYLQVNVNIIQFKAYAKTAAGRALPELFTRIESVALFADPEREALMTAFRPEDLAMKN